MNERAKSGNFLMDVEDELYTEVCQEMRERLRLRLQAEADLIGKLDSTGNQIRKARKTEITLISVFGAVPLQVWAGYAAGTKQWCVPVREAWRLDDSQRMLPSLQRKLCCTAAETGSFEKASRLAGEWGCTVSDDAIRACVVGLGEKAREKPLSMPCANSAGADDSLIIMMDGWMARHRGEDWGTKSSASGLVRVQWNEIKSAVIFRLRDLAQVTPKRRALLAKHVVAVQAETDPVTFGQRVEHEARRMGLATAKRVYVVMDGGVWLWNIFEDRFRRCAIGTLDFYHASQHLHALAAELFREDDGAAHDWCGKILHSLKHHSPERLFKTLADLQSDPPRNDEKTLAEITNACDYFGDHRDHMNYAQNTKAGAPIGSGSMESQCSQFQNRLKRRGQFWSQSGFAALLEIVVRHQNEELQTLWVA